MHRNRDWRDDITLSVSRYELWPEDDAYSRIALGIYAGSRGDLVAARHYLTRAISLDPDVAMAHGALAALERLNENPDKAKAQD